MLGEEKNMFSDRALRNLKFIGLQDRFKCARELKEIVESTLDMHMCVRTVQRAMIKSGLFSRRPLNKPVLSEKNIKARLAWAKEHVNWPKSLW